MMPNLPTGFQYLAVRCLSSGCLEMLRRDRLETTIWAK